MMIKKPRLTMSGKQAFMGLGFISFYLIGLAVFFLPAVVRSIVLCFQENGQNFDMKWVGWANFNYMFRVDPKFARNIVETIGGLLINAVVIILYSIFVCTLLNRELKGRGILRSLLFLPVVMSMGVVEKYMSFTMREGDIMSAVSGTAGSSGLTVDSIASVITSFNISADITGIIVSSIHNIYTVISHSGVQIVIFLAGLQSISKSVYEAARVEGCGPWETYWKITIPMLTPVIAVNVVYTVVDSFVSSNNVIMSKVFSYQTEQFKFGLASAMAWVYFLILIVFVVIIMAVLRKFTYYENA